VWAVGMAGTIRKLDASAKVFVPYDALDTKLDLHAVAATSPDDVWIAGVNGTVYRYDGNEWRRVRLAGLGKRRPTFTSAWTSPSGDVWFAGEGVVVSTRGKS